MNPKAPPVYKPVSSRPAAPPVYRPQHVAKQNLQLKPLRDLRLEKRPAPPVFYPQHSNPSVPSAVQGAGPSAQPALQYQTGEPVGSAHRHQQDHAKMKTFPVSIRSLDPRRGRLADPKLLANSLRKPPMVSVSERPLVPFIGSQQRLWSTPAGTLSSPVQRKLSPSISIASGGTLPRPASATRVFPVPPMRPAIRTAVVQRATSTAEGKEKAIEASVSVEKTGDPVSPAIVSEIENIIKAAAKAGGKESDTHGGLGALKTILADKDVAAAQPKDSEGTYAIASDASTLYASGPKKFVSAVVAAAAKFGKKEDVGLREDFVHGESHIYAAKSSITSVAATQPNCLFCYGFLETKGIDHQTLRGSPFPKGWNHPSGTFKLMLVNPQYGPKGKLVWISFAGSDRLYRVDY